MLSVLCHICDIYNHYILTVLDSLGNSEIFLNFLLDKKCIQESREMKLIAYFTKIKF
jgi:hypothetical protein